MTWYHASIFIAVGINLLAAANYFYWSIRYRRKIEELEELCHDTRNLQALLTEHIPVRRD